MDKRKTKKGEENMNLYEDLKFARIVWYIVMISLTLFFLVSFYLWTKTGDFFWFYSSMLYLVGIVINIGARYVYIWRWM